MPRKRSRGGLTEAQDRNLRFRADLLGTGSRTPVFANEAERRAAWQEHRERLVGLTVLGRRCPAFWQLEAGVPANLRRFPPVPTYGSVEAAAADHGRLARARDAWLLDHPEHLRPGERDVLLGLRRPDALGEA